MGRINYGYTLSYASLIKHNFNSIVFCYFTFFASKYFGGLCVSVGEYAFSQIACAFGLLFPVSYCTSLSKLCLVPGSFN